MALNEKGGMAYNTDTSFDVNEDFLSTTAGFADAQKTLEKNGKSFRFAQAFLGKKTATAAAKLYQFCRLCDDLVDEAPSPIHAKNRIQCLIKSMEQTLDLDTIPSLEDHSIPMVLKNFIDLQTHYVLPQHAVQQLLIGMQSDLKKVVKESEADLLIYCYRAAGSVGELMCPILGAPASAQPYAIDLGVAMQLTNIARDVQEDAQNGRIYLPQEWLGGMSCKTVLFPSPSQKLIIEAAIKRCLVLAEEYYASALQGLQLIPWKNRIAMHQALFIYRQIGLVLADNHYDYQQGRVVISTFDKILLVLRHSYKLLLAPSLEPHQSLLHEHFRTLYAETSNR